MPGRNSLSYSLVYGRSVAACCVTAYCSAVSWRRSVSSLGRVNVFSVIFVVLIVVSLSSWVADGARWVHDVPAEANSKTHNEVSKQLTRSVGSMFLNLFRSSKAIVAIVFLFCIIVHQHFCFVLAKLLRNIHSVAFRSFYLTKIITICLPCSFFACLQQAFLTFR